MRVRTLIGLVPLVLVALSAPAAAADSPPTFPILPNQYFSGVVNGKSDAAVVTTVCPGPVAGNGHPAGGQTLSVTRAYATTTANVGNTGARGTSVAAAPVTGSTLNVPVVFTEYLRASALPTAWTVPCDGYGRIAFTPQPDSYGAITAYVTVRFVNIAATP